MHKSYFYLFILIKKNVKNMKILNKKLKKKLLLKYKNNIVNIFICIIEQI